MIWLYKKDKIQNWSKKVLARPVTYIIDKGIEEWRAQRWIKKVFYKMTYKKLTKGRGGGQMVSVLAFNSDDPSSYPVKVNNLFVEYASVAYVKSTQYEGVPK